jgi:hypothetical protein
MNESAGTFLNYLNLLDAGEAPRLLDACAHPKVAPGVARISVLRGRGKLRNVPDCLNFLRRERLPNAAQLAAGAGELRGARCVSAALLAASALALASALPASAHNLAPAYLELREAPRGAVDVSWRLPAAMPRGARLEPVLPCPARGEISARAEGEAIVFSWRLACAGSLVGQRVAIDGLPGSGTDAIVSVALADGREVRAILTASAPALLVPPRERASAVLASYSRLGFAHLWTGLDHLLFVAGLALLLGATRALVVAVTAFTAGHSATLALAALGLVRVPQAAVEVAIAATILALALGLARSTRRADGPSPSAAPAIARRPALLPFAFGLLHGLGFAGALGEIGLPQHAIPLALFSFNLGIELGQLAWVGVLLAAAGAATRVAAPLVAPQRRRTLGREAAATALGALGAYWCLDRAATWLFP